MTGDRWDTPPSAALPPLPRPPGPPLPPPPAPPRSTPTASRPPDTLPGIEPVQLDPWDTPEPARRDLYDRTAWIERMIWRNGFLIMFVIGVVGFAFGALAWPYAAALALGGLAPGLFLMGREQAERNVEADRAMNRPETRHDGTLPPLRRTVRPDFGTTADD